ncbi:unnamed protein product [Colias eurytheme]|nr:unnamed protein product [Colias eurytheme]
MNTGWLVWECIVFGIFVFASSFAPLWKRKKDAKAGGNAKRAYIFAGGGVSVLAMVLSVARGTLGVRLFLGFPSELVYFGSAMWETLYGMILAFPIVCWVFIPVYFRLQTNSVYEYLEMRFGSKSVRRMAAATFLLRQILNLAVTVYTPTVALHAILGVPHWASAAALTVVAVVFNLLGGLAAAIRADVIQTLTMVLVSGAFIIQATIKSGGPVKVVRDNIEGGRMNFFNFTWDPTVRVGHLFGHPWPTLHVRIHIWLPTNIGPTLSWVVGMALYGLYRYCDPLMSGRISEPDEVLPFYVQDQFGFLPGMLGLFLGSIFNGALSFMVSNINSLSTVTWEDFISTAPAFRGISDKQQLTIIKVIGVIYAVTIMGMSLFVSLVNGVVEANMLVTSATSGALLGVFLLAALFPMANAKGALCGMVISHVLTVWMALGRLIYVDAKMAMLPLSVESCPNATLSALNPKPMAVVVNRTLTQYATVFDAIDSTHTPRPPTENLLFDTLMKVYSISYMWYAVIGTLVCVFCGIVIGYITGTDEDNFDERLIHPLVAKIARKMPGRQRTFTTVEREKTSEEKEPSDKTVETIVEDEKPALKPVFSTNNSKIFDVYDSKMSPMRTRL